MVISGAKSSFGNTNIRSKVLFFDVSFNNSQNFLTETGFFFFSFIKSPLVKRKNVILEDLINENIHLYNRFLRRGNYNTMCLNNF